MTAKNNKTNQTIPWQQLMQLGLGQLRLSPSEFWSCTPKEMKAAIEGLIGPASEGQISRKVVQQLMQKFPDRKENT